MVTSAKPSPNSQASGVMSLIAPVNLPSGLIHHFTILPRDRQSPQACAILLLHLHLEFIEHFLVGATCENFTFKSEDCYCHSPAALTGRVSCAYLRQLPPRSLLYINLLRTASPRTRYLLRPKQTTRNMSKTSVVSVLLFGPGPRSLLCLATQCTRAAIQLYVSETLAH